MVSSQVAAWELAYERACMRASDGMAVALIARVPLCASCVAQLGTGIRMTKRALAQGSLAIALLFGCGQRPLPPSGDAPPEPIGCPLPEPSEHRAKPVACDHERGPGDAMAMSFRNPHVPIETRPGGQAGAPAAGNPGLPPCSSDAECARDGATGRCENVRGSLMCTFDQCSSHDQCALGQACHCDGNARSDASACLPANCRTDADCASGYCSPSRSLCPEFGVVGYYCRTCEDECVEDSDCVRDGRRGVCNVHDSSNRFRCNFNECGA